VFRVRVAGQRHVVKVISQLEQAKRLDKAVAAGQRVARLIPAGRIRDSLHGVWLGHPTHPMLVQAPIGAWLSATAIGFTDEAEPAARLLTIAGLAASVPAALAGAADWAEQHEQQLRVGVVHALANSLAIACYGASLGPGSVRIRRLWRLAGLTSVAVGGVLGGHLSFRLAAGVNHSEAVPHLIEPGWHRLMPEAELADGKPVRRLLGEVPVVAVRSGDQIHVLADRCSHMSGSLAEGELEDGRLTCPWHGSVFGLSDGAVLRGPATAPQPKFTTRIADGTVEVLLPDAG
jgi:nitrite reductase/ring-hydroxylating ferredoxin subunit